MSEFLEWNQSRDPEKDCSADIALSGQPPSFVEGIDKLCDEFLALASPETMLVIPDLFPDEEIGETDTGHWFTPIRVKPPTSEGNHGLSYEDVSQRQFVHGAGSENKLHPDYKERIEISPKQIPGWQDFVASVVEILKDLKKSVQFEQLNLPPLELISEFLDSSRLKIQRTTSFPYQGKEYVDTEASNRDLLSLLQSLTQELAESQQKCSSLQKQLRKLRYAKYGSRKNSRSS